MTILREDRQDSAGMLVTTLTLDNPPVNVIDQSHCEQLSDALLKLKTEDRSRIVILRGAGRFFSSGVDIKQHTPQKMPELLPAFHDIFDHLLALNAITVAAIHGMCLGGAAELAFACDVVISDAKTQIGFPEIKVGCYPPVAVPLMMQRIGYGRTVKMLFSGDMFAASDLLSWGALDAVCEDGDLDAAIEKELAPYMDKSPAVVGMLARLMHDKALKGWAEEIRDLERIYLSELLPHPDASEGIAAFVEKRKPQWQARS